MRFRGEVETERIAERRAGAGRGGVRDARRPGRVSRERRRLDAVKLTLGKRNATAIEVKAGLAPGDRVSRIEPGVGARREEARRCSRCVAALGGGGWFCVAQWRRRRARQRADARGEEGSVRAPRDRRGQPARGQGDAGHGAAERRQLRADEDRVARARRRRRSRRARSSCGSIRREPEKQLRDGQADLAAADAKLAEEEIKSKTAVRGRDSAADARAAPSSSSRRKFQSKDKEIFSRNTIVESEIDEKLAGAKQQHAEQTKQIERKLAQSKAGVISVEKQKAQIAISHAKSALDEHGDQGAARRHPRAAAATGAASCRASASSCGRARRSPRSRCSTRWRPRCSCSRSTAAASPRSSRPSS